MITADVRRAVYDLVRQNPLGILRRDLQRRLGITDPNAEENRARVWRVSEAVAALVRDRFIVPAATAAGSLLVPIG